MRRASLILFSSILLLSTVNPSFSMIQNDDSQNNKKGIKSLAKAGNSIDQYKLGVIYLDESHNLDSLLQKSKKAKAIYWLEKSANQNYVPAQDKLWQFHYNKSNNGVIQKHRKKSFDWLKTAAINKSPKAQFMYGCFYQNGWEVPMNATKAATLWELAAKQGHKDAQYNTGLSYETGFGVTKNIATAIEWFGKAADQGHEEARLRLEKLFK